MNIDTFIDKYYLQLRQDKIRNLLISISAYDEIKSTLDDFYSSIKKKNITLVISQLTLTISDCVIALNKKLEKEKLNIEEEKELVEFGIYLIKETFELSNLNSTDYFLLLKNTIKTIYTKYSWDFSALESILNIDNIRNFAENSAKEINSKSGLIISKPLYLEWNHNTIPVSFFIDDVVKKFKGIKTRDNLFKLFDKIDNDFIVFLNSKYLVEFISLFYFLNRKGIISTKGNKGLYKYLKQHIKPIKNDNFPNLDFRRIRYNAFQKENIKSNIEKSLEPFIHKYCGDGQ